MAERAALEARQPMGRFVFGASLGVDIEGIEIIDAEELSELSDFCRGVSLYPSRWPPDSER